MIILRISKGIYEHFPYRVTEWIMTGALFAFAGMLAGSGDAFLESHSFRELARYGDGAFWATICMAAGFIRLAALVVNGTFKQFRYSPHMRAGASVVACVFWGQIELAVTAAWLSGTAVGTGSVAYGTFMAIEVWNLIRAWADVGAARRRG